MTESFFFISSEVKFLGLNSCFIGSLIIKSISYSLLPNSLPLHRGVDLFSNSYAPASSVERVVEVHAGLHLHAFDVLLPEKQLAVLDDEERPLDSSSVGVEPDLLVGDVAHDRYLLRDLVAPAKLLDALQQVVWIVVSADPVSVDKDFHIFSSSDH